MGKQATVLRQVYRVHRTLANAACHSLLSFLLLLLLLALSPVPAAAQAPEVTADLPPHMYVDAALEKTVRTMLQQSPTFRAQIARLARTRALGVAIVLRPTPGGSADATIRRYNSGAILAVLSIRSKHDHVELLAHEVEHLIEQIERVPLELLARISRGVWQAGQSYETIRAIETGQRVRREIMARSSTEP